MSARIRGTSQIKPLTVSNDEIVSLEWSKITGTPTSLDGYGITSPLPAGQGGTAQDTSAWSGVPTINAGAWTQNSVLTATRVLFAGAGNTIGSDADLTFSVDTLTATKVVAPTSVSTPAIITAAGALTVTPAAGSNLNINLSTTGDLAVNTDQFYIDTSTGNVGIGIGVPITPLHIAGAVPSIATLDNSAAISAAGDLYGSVCFQGRNAGGTGYTTAASAIAGTHDPRLAPASRGGMLRFQTALGAGALTDAMVITSNGNIGIGTLLPSVPLEVDGSGTTVLFKGTNTATFTAQKVTSSASNSLFYGVESSGGGAFFTGGLGNAGAVGTSTATALQLATNNSVRLTILSAGNVGVGTTNPLSTLHLKAGSATANTAPLQFTSGALETVPRAGVVEFLTDAYYGTITTGAARKTFAFLESPAFTTPDIGAATGASLALTAAIGKYKNVNTAGWGVAAIYASGRSIAQTAAVASVATYTNGAADGSFLISANVNVTTSTTHNFSVQVDYTDETNTAQTLTLTFSQLTGVLTTTITNVTGAGPYDGLVLRIRCKASTAITVKTTGTFTTVTYNVEAAIQQIA